MEMVDADVVKGVREFDATVDVDTVDTIDGPIVGGAVEEGKQ